MSDLIDQLGFSIPKTIIEQKLLTFNQDSHDRIWVAKIDGTIIGLVAINIINPFYSPGYFGRIDTIVVDKSYRQLGVAKALMVNAERYAKKIGCKRIFLTSGNHRIDAHDFYRHINYISNATYFVKYLE